MALFMCYHFGDVQALAVCSVEMIILHRNRLLRSASPTKKSCYKYVRSVVWTNLKYSSARLFVIEGYKHA
jgi:hypothetical protein